MKESSTNNFNRTEALFKCPVTFTLEMIGGRWKPLIIWQLKEGKMRYSELKRALPLISEKMLIQHLKELESDNLLIRHQKPVVPPFVEYELTAMGEEIKPILSAMGAWGLKYQSAEMSQN